MNFKIEPSNNSETTKLAEPPESTSHSSTPHGKRVPSFLGELFSFIKTLILFIGVAFLIRAVIVEPFKIPSESMLPTLKIGDQLLVSKFSYGLWLPFRQTMLFQYAEPKRGDVVVFTHPDDPLTAEDESEINIIKRVVGLPGDIVEVRGSRLYINNQEYVEPYARWVLGGVRDGYFGPEKVPEGRLFLLGDNRDKSRDSRFWSYPYLDQKRVKGRAVVIYWSLDDLSRIGTLIR